MRHKTLSKLYGFEDYSIILLFSSDYLTKPNNYYISSYLDSQSMYITSKQLSLQVDSRKLLTEHCAIEENKEALNNAKTVWVHSDCTIPRALFSSLYKKTKTAWSADIVIVPETVNDNYTVDKALVYINESDKIVTIVPIYKNEDLEIAQALKIGDAFRDHCVANLCSYWSGMVKVDTVLDSRLMYFGDVIRTEYNNYALVDILTSQVPSDRIVFEDTFQKSLTNESNAITKEILLSIREMLCSKDTSVVNTALKSLATLDWIHYPNCVRLIFNYTTSNNWKYVNAADSVLVKYMFKTLAGNAYKNNYPGKYDRTISSDDYELFKDLYAVLEKIDSSDVLQFLRYYNFMAVDYDGKLVPSLKL